MDNESLEPITRKEHNSSAGAKRVIGTVFNPSTGSYEAQSISMGKLVYEKFDYISRTLTNSTTETYIYKLGGSGGTTVATVTVVYTGSTLETISSVTRT